MDKEALKRAWDARGKQLDSAYRATKAEGSDTTHETLKAAADLNRFLDHGFALSRLDNDIGRRLDARTLAGEPMVQGYDRLALQAERARLTEEYMWFMEYRRESDLKPVNPGTVVDGLRRIELSKDGTEVVSGWNPDSALGRSMIVFEDARSAVPAFGDAVAKARSALSPSYQTCVALNQASAAFLGGQTAAVPGKTLMAGRMAADTWGEGVGAAHRMPAENFCRLVYPDHEAGRVRQRLHGQAPDVVPVQVAESAVAAGSEPVRDTDQVRTDPQDGQQAQAPSVDVPVPWLGALAVTDVLAFHVAQGRLEADEAAQLLRSSTGPDAGVSTLWPELLAQARGPVPEVAEADTSLTPGRSFVQSSGLLSEGQKANFERLLSAFAEPLQALPPDQRVMAEEVMALHYVDEVSVCGGLNRPLDTEVVRSLCQGPANGLPGAAEGPEDKAEALAEPPEALKARQAQVVQSMAPLLGSEAAAGWSSQDHERLQAHALQTTVRHHLGPDMVGAWLSADRAHIGLLDSTGVLREFAVADALAQDAEVTHAKTGQIWAAQHKLAQAPAPTGKSRRHGDGHGAEEESPSGSAAQMGAHQGLLGVESGGLASANG